MIKNFNKIKKIQNHESDFVMHSKQSNPLVIVLVNKWARRKGCEQKE